MKKEKEFANILDECLERIIARGETVGQCLVGYPEHAAELEPLLRTALAAKEAADTRPSREFRERARYQFLLAIQDMEVKTGRVRWFFGWQPAWVTAVIVLLVIVLAGGGTAAAASDSMPDEPLYQVKLTTEAVRLALTPSALGKAELYVRFADDRVAEIIEMADKGKPEQVEKAVWRLDEQLIAMANLTAPVEEAAEPEAAMLEAPASQAQIREAEPVPAPATAPRPEDLEEAPPKASPKAPGLPEGAGPGKGREKGKDIKFDKQARLRGVLARRAEENRDALQEVLERVPESVKPALQQAIEVAGVGYERALRSLD